MSDDSCDWEEAHGVACGVLVKARAEVERLRAVITRAKDALLDGQSTQWVHDLLVAELVRKP